MAALKHFGLAWEPKLNCAQRSVARFLREQSAAGARAYRGVQQARYQLLTQSGPPGLPLWGGRSKGGGGAWGPLGVVCWLRPGKQCFGPWARPPPRSTVICLVRPRVLRWPEVRGLKAAVLPACRCAGPGAPTRSGQPRRFAALAAAAGGRHLQGHHPAQAGREGHRCASSALLSPLPLLAPPCSAPFLPMVSAQHLPAQPGTAQPQAKTAGCCQGNARPCRNLAAPLMCPPAEHL